MLHKLCIVLTCQADRTVKECSTVCVIDVTKIRNYKLMSNQERVGEGVLRLMCESIHEQSVDKTV